LKRLFPDVLTGSLSVDNRTGSGIGRLREAIAEQAAKLPQMGQLISRRWAVARDEILASGDGQPQIWYEQFSEICERHGMTDSEINTLARLMHDLGDVMYFGEQEGLRDIVVLDPEWLTRAISRILEDVSTKQADGVLDHARLREIWDYQGYSALDGRYFLRLMEEFDISYRLDDMHSLVAQLVPFDRPPLPWQAGSALPAGLRKLRLVCRPSEPAPGLIPWLTVRHHRASTGKHWRRGVFLRHPIKAYASEALLELQHNGELTIEVRAPSPDLYFNILRDSVEDLISRRWPGLTYQLLIPCLGLTNDGACCPGEFHLDGLKRLHEGGKTTIPCMQCAKDNKISELLTGFAAPDNQLAAQLDGMNAMLTDASNRIAHIQGRATDIAETVRRVQRVVSMEVTDCPRLFSLLAGSTPPYQHIEFHQESYRLTLWCEHPGFWHPWEQASYELRPPKRWLPQVRPYLLLVFRTLQLIVPLTGSTASPSSPADVLDQARSHLQAMGRLMADQPGNLGNVDSDRHRDGRKLTEAEGRALRAIRVALFEHDLSRAFGGMRRVQDASGDFLWVCPMHYPEYDPGLPNIPA
jgi:internalin A